MQKMHQVPKHHDVYVLFYIRTKVHRRLWRGEGGELPQLLWFLPVVTMATLPCTEGNRERRVPFIVL